MKKAKGAELLPDELLWADGGHASDVVLTALADGQVDIVPPAVMAHVGGCDACTTQLGNTALLSLHAGRELAVLARVTREAEGVRRPVPRLAIALGLAFAVLGLVPSLLDAPSEIHTTKTLVTQDLPMFATGLSTLGHKLLEPGSSVGLVLTYGAAALVVLMAFALVRLLPKKDGSR